MQAAELPGRATASFWGSRNTGVYLHIPAPRLSSELKLFTLLPHRGCEVWQQEPQPHRESLRLKSAGRFCHLHHWNASCILVFPTLVLFSGFQSSFHLSQTSGSELSNRRQDEAAALR